MLHSDNGKLVNLHLTPEERMELERIYEANTTPRFPAVGVITILCLAAFAMALPVAVQVFQQLSNH